MRRWIVPAALALVAVAALVAIQVETSNAYVIDRVRVYVYETGAEYSVPIPSNVTLPPGFTYWIYIDGRPGTTYRIAAGSNYTIPWQLPRFTQYPCVENYKIWWEYGVFSFITNATYKIEKLTAPSEAAWIYVEPLPDRDVAGASAYPACSTPAVA
ncbi:MAG: hypothetical protein C0167_02100 [Nitrososphaera sp.]|nr:MAG: hypothetical protein C0167_02100 [Nitrososphaera sp.]